MLCYRIKIKLYIHGTFGKKERFLWSAELGAGPGAQQMTALGRERIGRAAVSHRAVHFAVRRGRRGTDRFGAATLGRRDPALPKTLLQPLRRGGELAVHLAFIRGGEGKVGVVDGRERDKVGGCDDGSEEVDAADEHKQQGQQCHDGHG